MEMRKTENRKLYIGIYLIIVGILWIVWKLIPDNFLDNFPVWTLIFIGVGIFALLGGNKIPGLILIIIGGALLIPSFYLKTYLIPILIICFGLLILARSRNKNIEPKFDIPLNNPGIDYFDDFVIFGGREVLINSQNFFGGKTTSMFGGTEYDLRQTRLAENGAIIDCLTIFGGCGFKVPPDWTIKNEVTSIFGAFTDKRGATFNNMVSNPSKTLILKGFSAFGGIEIKHF